MPSLVVVVQADRFLTFFSPTENDVLVPVLARSIDVVVVSFVVDLKLPNDDDDDDDDDDDNDDDDDSDDDDDDDDDEINRDLIFNSNDMT